MRSPRTRVRPSLEYLEDRFVPATVRLVSGDLLVSNLLIVGSRASVTLQATTNNTFQVVDTEGGTGSASLGTYAVAGNIIVSGTNANDSITVNLNGHTFTGNVLINGGNGNDSIVVTGAGKGNVIGGNVTLLHGAGNASVSINPTTSSALTIGGSVTADNTTNAYSTFHLGNASATTNVGGATTLTGFSDNGAAPAVQIGAGQHDTIGSQLTVTNPGNNNASVVLGSTTGNASITQGVTTGGLNIQEGSGNDTVTFLGSSLIDEYVNDTYTLGLGTTINGNTNVQFGNGNDFFNVLGFRGVNSVMPGGEETVFNGNVSYIAGNGNDSISLSGGPLNGQIGVQIYGNLNIQLGDGNNDFGDTNVIKPGSTTGNTGLDYQTPFVNGNLTLTTGNGSNVMDAFGINVQGNEAFHFGNGNNGTPSYTPGGVPIPGGAPILIRRPSDGTLTATFGNGNNYLQLATPLMQIDPSEGPLDIPSNFNFNVNIQFGNGSDTFQVGAPAGQDVIPAPPGSPTPADYQDHGGVLTGQVIAGTSATNTFLQGPLWTLASNLTLANFP